MILGQPGSEMSDEDVRQALAMLLGIDYKELERRIGLLVSEHVDAERARFEPVLEAARTLTGEDRGEYTPSVMADKWDGLCAALREYDEGHK